MEVTAPPTVLNSRHCTWIERGSFEPRNHFYPRVLNAQIHPLVSYFLRMSNQRLISRYCHLNPRVDPAALEAILASVPEHFRWAGADLFCTTTASGDRRLVVIETNSCPSGNKAMPIPSDDDEQGGYRQLMSKTFLPMLLEKRGSVAGGLAVLFDKNYTEAWGYAAALADLTGERVALTPCLSDDEDPPARVLAGVLEVRSPDGRWEPMRAAFRYVTQRPWNRIPVRTRTRILNPVIACLAGGRNKLIAAKAYELYNADLETAGLRIRTPETIRDVSKEEIPLWVKRFGGQAVIKIPYGNAGQGVFTILSQPELDAFMAADYRYERYIVQSLIGNYTWSSQERAGRFYHVGTMPDRHGHIYVADLRVMICATDSGFRPLAVYARRARRPLATRLEDGASSWDVLGTNLSERQPDGGWAAETDRLLLMDRRDFNTIGIGADDLIEAYIQTVLATTAIDRMAAMLTSKKGEFRLKLFRSLDDDEALIQEIHDGSRGKTASTDPVR